MFICCWFSKSFLRAGLEIPFLWGCCRSAPPTEPAVGLWVGACCLPALTTSGRLLECPAPWSCCLRGSVHPQPRGWPEGWVALSTGAESLVGASPSCPQPQLCACSAPASCAPACWPASAVALCISPFAVVGGSGLGLCLLLHHRTSGDESPSQAHVPRVSL